MTEPRTFTGIGPHPHARSGHPEYGVVIDNDDGPRLVEWSCWAALSTIYAHKISHREPDSLLDDRITCTPDQVYVVYRLTHGQHWFEQPHLTHSARTGDGLPKLPDGW